MGTVQFRSGNRSNRETLLKSNVLVVAVDLGFANKSKTCGIAWRLSSEAMDSPLERPEPLSYGDCIKKVTKLICDSPIAVLIIEAPLSAAFNEDGNPMGRGDLEMSELNAVRTSKRRPAKKRSARYWYCGAGAPTCLAAIFFLRELVCQLQSDTRTMQEIVLFEGFISFKDKKKKKSNADHADEAKQLLEWFINSKSSSDELIRMEQSRDWVSVTDLIAGSKSDKIAPAVIKPRKMIGRRRVAGKP